MMMIIWVACLIIFWTILLRLWMEMVLLNWASKLGPIPSEIFREKLPPVGNCIVGGSSGGCGDSIDFLNSIDFLTVCCGPNVGTYEPTFQIKETLISGVKPQQPTFSQDKRLYGVPKSFEAPSPDSVLERRISSSACKTVLFGTEITIPVRTRTKRSWSGLTTNPWSKSLLLNPLQNVKKNRNLPQHDVNETKKCTHCEITRTPQWREGPMGPKTLCNACGVRYRSGRLFPEYRPTASPTFISSLHSNSHRKTYIVKKPLGSNIQTQKHTRLCS
ncbi:putative transcription factor C2C2-GATA family [Helianthus annuus]|uniref:Transcription factor C2C2-GATA family n=1 Tax=Helianthus annuus TaxID=4232 RepID=A0A9K3HRP8_HELAN|nr:putative transcription factor C2C2-GATA family [Helianthus annuus]